MKQQNYLHHKISMSIVCLTSVLVKTRSQRICRGNFVDSIKEAFFRDYLLYTFKTLVLRYEYRLQGPFPSLMFLFQEHFVSTIHKQYEK